MDTSADLLVERDDEIHRLRGMLQDLRSHGVPGVVTVVGEFGSGRSALLDRTVRLAGTMGIPSMVARCSPHESSLRYEMAHQLLSSVDIRVPSLTAARRASARFAESALCAELCRPVIEWAREAGLVVIDEVQFADPESYRWVQALMRQLSDAPILVVMSVSVGMFAHACCYDAWHNARTWSLSASEIVRLKPLTRSGIAAVLEASCGGPVDEEYLDAVVRVTGGNPAVLHGVVQHFRHRHTAPTTAAVAEIEAHAAGAVHWQVARVLESLPADLVGVLRAVAVADGRLPADLIGSVAGDAKALPMRKALRTARELGLVTGQEWPRLTDRRTAEPILATLGAQDRYDMYAKAAELGHRVAIPDKALADILLEARPIHAPWAVELLRSVAMHSGTPDDPTPIRLLRHALMEQLSDLERAETLVELGCVEVPSDPGASDAHLAQAATAPGDDTLIPVRRRALDLLLARGAAVLAEGLVARVWERLCSAQRSDRQLQALYWLASFEEPLQTRPLMGLPSVGPLPDVPSEPAQAAVKAWQLAAWSRDLESARRLARFALASPVPKDALLMPRIAAGKALTCTDDTDEALVCLDSVLLAGRRMRAWAVTGRALITRACIHLRCGRLDDMASDLARLDGEVSPRCWHPSIAANIAGLTAALHLQRGEIEQAERIVARPVPPVAAENGGAVWLLFARGYLRYMTGDPRAAAEDLEECGRRLLSRQILTSGLIPWRMYAVLAMHACGDEEGAIRLADEQRRVARQWGTDSVLGDALFATGMINEGERREQLLTNAEQLLAGTPTQLRHARVLVELAEARVPRLGLASAIPLLRRAAKFAQMHGVWALAERVSDVAHRLGLDSDQRRHRLVDQLTDTDERLIDLAGQGLSNREIAAELAVTQRTVERRLTAVYRKLGIDSRTALRFETEQTREETHSRAV
jgi:DNA-binding CsgD family transcriptional regulator